MAWAPIPQEHVNGILRGYYVIYWKMPRVSHDNRIIQVNQSTLSVVIVGLNQNTTYGVRLTGFTRIRGFIRNGVLGRAHNVTTEHGEKKICPIHSYDCFLYCKELLLSFEFKERKLFNKAEQSISHVK